MASTNKTTNYELSQYIGTDKPTYLGDYNSDMSKIDTQMKANETAVNIVKTTADTALENAETAQTEATQALNTGNTANQTATSALEKATANEAKITEINNKLVYSTEEQVIGKWINGKTLYRKSIYSSYPERYGFTDTLLSGIDEGFILFGAIQGSGGGKLSIPNSDKANLVVRSNGNMDLDSPSSMVSISYNLTVIYTKLAD